MNNARITCLLSKYFAGHEEFTRKLTRAKILKNQINNNIIITSTILDGSEPILELFLQKITERTQLIADLKSIVDELKLIINDNILDIAYTALYS